MISFHFLQDNVVLFFVFKKSAIIYVIFHTVFLNVIHFFSILKFFLSSFICTSLLQSESVWFSLYLFCWFLFTKFWGKFYPLLLYFHHCLLLVVPVCVSVFALFFNSFSRNPKLETLITWYYFLLLSLFLFCSFFLCLQIRYCLLLCLQVHWLFLLQSSIFIIFSKLISDVAWWAWALPVCFISRIIALFVWWL